MGYIEKQHFKNNIREILNDSTCPLHISATIDQYLDEEPEVNVSPVVHGKWVKEPVEFWSEPDYRCSICGCYAITDSKNRQLITKYCPDCGAKMDQAT